MIIFAPIIYISCAGFDCELEKEFFPGIDSVSIFYIFMRAEKFCLKKCTSPHLFERIAHSLFLFLCLSIGFV